MRTRNGPGSVGGSTSSGNNFTTALAQVTSASTTLQNLTANYTVGALTTPQTFSAVDPVTVIDIDSIGGSADIRLDGGAYSVFVINVKNGVAFTGSTAISGINGTTPDHILINFYNSTLGGLGTSRMSAHVLIGTILVPYDTATFHSANGAIYAQNQQITLMSGATVTQVPFTPPPPPPVPEPGSLVLLGSGVDDGSAAVASAAVARRRRGARHRPVNTPSIDVARLELRVHEQFTASFVDSPPSCRDPRAHARCGRHAVVCRRTNGGM